VLGRRATIGVVVASLVLTAACGTRLPDSAFTRSGENASSAAPQQQGPDVGVTANQITIGIMASLTGPLGSDTFSPPMYGARAYFAALNARGGVNGRTVNVVTCDDQSTGSGNQQCVHALIDNDHVFALTATTVLDYAGASYVNSKGVPDVGGEPVTTAYNQYEHLYSIAGSYEPRDGTVGWDGKIDNSTEVYRWLHQKLGARTAAVVYYNQASSARYARQIEHGLRVEGVNVVPEEVDFALPDFTSAVLDLKSRKVDVVFDALDTSGNSVLCRAIDAQGVQLKAKMTTVQGWNDQVRRDYADAPGCRNVLYATANERNYEDTSVPVVKRFRDDVAKYFPQRPLSMWMVEGWTAAQWLTDAIASCGANVPRHCVEAFMNRPTPYVGHGMIVPLGFERLATPPKTIRTCFNVARWQDSAQGGHGGWVTAVPDMMTNCYEVPDPLDSA
jgi:branched-chain amino acid transport system substrate-binding protein